MNASHVSNSKTCVTTACVEDSSANNEAVIEPPYLYKRETEILQFTPLSFVDKVLDLINKHSTNAMEQLKKDLKPKLKNSKELEHGIQKCSSLLTHSVDKMFEKWENFCLEGLFVLPNQVPPAVDENVPMDEEAVLEKKREYFKLKKSKVKVSMEINAIKSALENCDIILTRLKPFRALSLDVCKDISKSKSLGKELNELYDYCNKIEDKIQLLLSNGEEPKKPVEHLTFSEEANLYQELSTRASLQRSDLSLQRPVLEPNEVILQIQDKVGVYDNQQRLLDFDSGTLYLTKFRIIWTDLVSAYSFHLESIDSLDFYPGFLASHPKIIISISSILRTPLDWKCNICYQIQQVLLFQHTIKCIKCGVLSKLEQVSVFCNRCTLEQKGNSKCQLCGSDWFIEQRTPIGTVKFSFRGGGYEKFHSTLKDALHKINSNISHSSDNNSMSVPKSFGSFSNPNTIGKVVSIEFKPGVSGLMMAAEEESKKIKQDLNLAFSDIDALMSRAEEMVKLSQSIARSSVKDENLDNILFSLGISNPVTKEMAGSSYYNQLASELTQLIVPLLKDHPIIALTDLYCIVNKARRVSLISPNDLVKACLCFKTDQIMYKEYGDGKLKVVQSVYFDEEAVLNRILEYAKQRSSTGVAVYELASLERISLSIAQEYLQIAETKGLICRDDVVQGLFFYENKFL